GLHTLKGGARMAGLAPIGDLGHTMESLLEAMAEGKRDVTRAAIEALEHGFDLLHDLVQRVRMGRAVAMPDNAIGYFQMMIAGDPLVAPTEEAQSELTEVIDLGSEPEPGLEAPTAHAPHAPERALATGTRGPQEMIRVRSELLDSL